MRTCVHVCVCKTVRRTAVMIFLPLWCLLGVYVLWHLRLCSVPGRNRLSLSLFPSAFSTSSRHIAPCLHLCIFIYFPITISLHFLFTPSLWVSFIMLHLNLKNQFRPANTNILQQKWTFSNKCTLQQHLTQPIFYSTYPTKNWPTNSNFHLQTLVWWTNVCYQTPSFSSRSTFL